MAWEETPCAKCELKEFSGRTIEFDQERMDAKALEGVRRHGLRAGEAPMEGEEDPGELKVPMSVMREALATLLMLEPAVRDVVAWRFSGMKYPEIALVQNVTTAAVEARHKRAMRQHPILRALFPVKVAKQSRRKPYERKAA
jgi:hypothetical protein